MKEFWESQAYNLKKVYGSDLPMQIILAVSLIVTAVLFVLGFFAFIGSIDLSFLGLAGFDLLVFAVLSAIGPIGFYSYLKTKKKTDIQNQLPDFLREISGSTASGMTVFDAITSAAEADHGKLTPEIKRMTAQLSWGISVHDALNNFAKRINTDAVKRMTITINKALEIGGNTASVFEAAAKEIDQAKRVEMQRKAEMSMYSIVIFISFFVFLAVILIIDKTIFTAIFDLQDQMAGQSIGNMQIAQIDSELLKYTFFSFVLVQSVGGGLLGGFMMDGKLSSGVRFGFILVLVSFFVFKFMF
ncbi:MAG: type II secretion system F family protein [Candidatus Thermoplasmatota archaeon]|nr:type II secretion system F family protein [Candidatus Thermoplasmatota archaeon]MBS3802321.1 type II secretion system F family protein [Candidatus Thermoplasmatota archaeon]